jgi:hypothetical protein
VRSVRRIDRLHSDFDLLDIVLLPARIPLHALLDEVRHALRGIAFGLRVFRDAKAKLDLKTRLLGHRLVHRPIRDEAHQIVAPEHHCSVVRWRADGPPQALLDAMHDPSLTKVARPTPAAVDGIEQRVGNRSAVEDEEPAGLVRQVDPIVAIREGDEAFSSIA